MSTKDNPVETLTITNFGGSMTEYVHGEINSGRANVLETYGNNPFSHPGELTWSPLPVQVDPTSAVITDLIVAGKERLESGILYVYAIGHTGRLYKIQVNDPATYNTNYDTPVLITTLAAQTPTFTRGGFMEFFGATERIYIGHDKGVTRIDFDGANETFVGALGSWTQNVPRPLKQFLGNLYAGSGTNLVEILPAGTVNTYTKLSPAFPTASQVRDIDVTPEGTYLEAVVSRIDLGNIIATTPNVAATASSESYIFRWNGTDAGYTSFATFPSFSLSANTLFQNRQFTFGSDQYGSAVFDPLNKVIAEPEMQPALPNAVSSTGNLLSWVVPYYFEGNLYILNNIFGAYDWEIGRGYWSLFDVGAKSPETDIIRVPCQIPVSNFGLGATSSGYTNGIYGTGKIYFSTLETSSAPTTAYRFYRFAPISSPSVSNGTPQLGVYQTQTQLFSKKVQIKEVRVYGQPWTSGVSFKVDIIGSNRDPITGATKTLTVGTNITSGDDFAWYTPESAPTFAIGLRVSNLGSTNHVISKVEIDYSAGGK